MINNKSSLTPLRLAQLSNRFFQESGANAKAIKALYPEVSSLAVTKALLDKSVSPEVSAEEITVALDNAGLELPAESAEFFDLGFKPSFHLRDNMDDIGDEPSSGSFWMSPDIICSVRPILMLKSAFKDQNKLYGGKPGKGAPSYFYVRTRNLGTMAGKPRVHLFWSPQSSFVSPETWQPMGTINYENAVPVNGSLVGGPLVWTMPQESGLDDLSIVAIAESDEDPRTIPTKFENYEDFTNWVSGTNNVAMKSINQLLLQIPERLTPAPSDNPFEPTPIVIPKFHMRCPPGILDRFSLAVTTDLPAGTRIRAVLNKTKTKTFYTGGLAYVLFSSIRFDPDEIMEVEVEVDLPWGSPAGIYTLHLRQTAERYTVGGVSSIIDVRVRSAHGA